MEAKDTVMSKLGMEEVTSMGYSSIFEFGERIARAQAKISFEAGIKEVVDDLTMAIASSSKATEQAESAVEVLRKYEAKLKE